MTKEKKLWKPEFKYETLIGTFTDYRGNERDFTMVAVSIPMQDTGAVVSMPVEYEDTYEIPGKNVLNEETGQIEYVAPRVETFINEDEEILTPVAKMLSIGVSVRSVRDKDTGISERIAYGKAVTLQDHTLYVSHPGMINTTMVLALLKQESEYFKRDPGSYIKGYAKAKKDYQEKGIIAEPEKTVEDCEGHEHKNKRLFDDGGIPLGSGSPVKIKQRLLKEVDKLEKKEK